MVKSWQLTHLLIGGKMPKKINSKRKQRTRRRYAYIALVQHTEPKPTEERIIFKPIAKSIWDWKVYNMVRRADHKHSLPEPICWSRDSEASLYTDRENYFFFAKNSNHDGLVRTFGFINIPKKEIAPTDTVLPWLEIKRWQEHINPVIAEYWNIKQIHHDFNGIF